MKNTGLSYNISLVASICCDTVTISAYISGYYITDKSIQMVVPLQLLQMPNQSDWK